MTPPSVFRTEAERIAEGVREEMGLTNLRRLDPLELFAFLEVPVISMTELGRIQQGSALLEAIRHLQEEETSLSALTVFRGTQRMVVYNDAASPGRQNSDLAHEAAHGLLLHTPTPALDDYGCRIWDEQVEDEAQYLAGCLLIPGKGARYAAKAGWPMERMAAEFGCSTEMARWRNNAAGGQAIRRKKLVTSPDALSASTSPPTTPGRMLTPQVSGYLALRLLLWSQVLALPRAAAVSHRPASLASFTARSATSRLSISLGEVAR